jgi:HK97 family phage major capsid protein
MSKKLREFQVARAKSLDAMKEINGRADASGALSAEDQAAYDQHKATAANLAGAIARETDLIAEQAQAGVFDATPPATGPPGFAFAVSVNDNREADPKHGFKNKGDFFKAVKAAADARSTGMAVDERLRIGAAAPGTYSNESSGADGAFAIPPEFSGEIWRLSLGEGSLLPMTANTEVQGNSMVFPKDETTPWGSTGVQAYWKGEGPTGSESKINLGTDMLRLKELMVLAPVTNELLDDAAALGSYLTPLASDRIQWKTNEAILFGTGGAQPLGCMNANTKALIVVAKETGQAAASLLQANISKMRSRLKAGELKNAIWVGNPDILPALEGLIVGQIPIFLPPGTGLREGGYDGTLNGRPLILSEHANALGAQSDLSLLALNGYRTITKAGGIETATSMHLYFDANATAFRFIFRMDGQPIITAPIQPPAGKSSNTRSYFVTLAARP